MLLSHIYAICAVCLLLFPQITRHKKNYINFTNLAGLSFIVIFFIAPIIAGNKEMLEDELFYTVIFISFLIFYISSKKIQFTKKKECKYMQKNNVSLVFVYMFICLNLYRIIPVIIAEGFLSFFITIESFFILNFLTGFLIKSSLPYRF